jgi:hypothetical protein
LVQSDLLYAATTRYSYTILLSLRIIHNNGEDRFLVAGSRILVDLRGLSWMVLYAKFGLLGLESFDM